MQRSKHYPDWRQPHLLSFITDRTGEYVAIHADLAGVTMLIDELEAIRAQLERNECPHTHLMSPDCAGDELTTAMISDTAEEANAVCHVKIYGWNAEWAVHHGLEPGADSAQ